MRQVAIVTIVILAGLAALIGQPSVGKYGLNGIDDTSIYFEPYWSDCKAGSLHFGKATHGRYAAAFYWRDIQQQPIPAGIVCDSFGLRIQRVN